MQDINWLLSTIVQSAAAFVAIVGGFVISRLLALSAEKGGLQNRIRDLDLQLKIKDQQIQPLQKRRLDWEAEYFLENSDVLNVIMESEGNISLSDVMKRPVGDSYSEDALQPYWDEAIELTKRAFPLIKNHISELLDYEGDLASRLKNLGLDISSYRLNLYEHIIGELMTRSRAKQNSFLPTLSEAFATQVTGAMDGGTVSAMSAIDENNRFRQLHRDIEKLEMERDALKTQVHDLKAQLQQLAQPEDVTPGLWILTYIAITGILIPIFIMPYPAEQFSIIHKWFVAGVFLSGLVLFIAYLFHLKNRLAR
jgi:hypothetical protein